jgi:hypothetical protein
MKIFRVCYSCFLIWIVGAASLTKAEERIWLSAKINDQPVHLCFDTGCNGNVLTPQTVKKLGLKFIPAPTNVLSRGVLAGDTEICTVTIDGGNVWTSSFLVLDLPTYTYGGKDFDGLIGWWSMSPNIMRIDAVSGKVTPLYTVPKHATKWNQLSILALTNSGTLDLQIPHADRTNGVVLIDTGDDSGFALPENEWNLWRETHSHIPITLETLYTPSDGFYVTEEAWADQIAIGSIILTNVPIRRAGPAGAEQWGAQYEGTLGLAALKRLEIIVDGKNCLAYLKPKATTPPAYRHNRLGAVFVPTANYTNQAVAQVVEGSPAYDAGVRNGDILLQVDKIPVRSWSDDWRSHFFLPAGTKLNLTLMRDGKTFKTTATLRQILQSSSHKNK